MRFLSLSKSFLWQKDPKLPVNSSCKHSIQCQTYYNLTCTGEICLCPVNQFWDSTLTNPQCGKAQYVFKLNISKASTFWALFFYLVNRKTVNIACVNDQCLYKDLSGTTIGLYCLNGFCE